MGSTRFASNDRLVMTHPLGPFPMPQIHGIWKGGALQNSQTIELCQLSNGVARYRARITATNDSLCNVLFTYKIDVLME